MLPYYLAYGMMIAMGIWYIHISSFRFAKVRKKYCILWAVIWIILLGLRHPSMGVDLQYGSIEGYLGRFQIYSVMNWNFAFRERRKHGFELGYVIFNKLLGYLGDDPQILLFACAAISICFTAIWLYKNSDYPVLSSVIFCGTPMFLANFSALRQVIAIAITFVAYESIKEKKLVRFGLLIVLASYFHKSAWMFLLAYPLYWMRVGIKGRITSIILMPLFYIFRYPLFTVLSKLLKDHAQPDYNNAITLFLVFCSVYIFCALFARTDDQEEQGWCNLFMLACLCQAFGGVYNTAMRVGWYFMPYLSLLLPRIVWNTECVGDMKSRKSGLMMYLVILLCFGAFGIFSLSRGSWAMSNPYHFFWRPME